jgi:hypothetical protein
LTQLSNDCSCGVIALRFAKALAAEEFEQAYGMLTPATRDVMSKQDLIEQYTDMVSYGQGPADLCEVGMVQDDWPTKGKNDLAWVYVCICGPGFSEAVVAVVVDGEHTTGIRIEDWGRP